MLYYFFTPSKEGVVREPPAEINSGMISLRFAIFRRRIVKADARDARNISRRYDSVNLIPYRAQRDTAIYHCSMWQKHSWMSYERQRTICHGYYLTRLILRCDLALFLSLPRLPFLLILRFVTPTRSSGHVRSARALSYSVFEAENHLGRAFGQLLEWISATRPGQIFWTGLAPAHTCGPCSKKKKNYFQPANRPGRVSARQPSQPVISIRLDGCNWIFRVCSIGLAMAARDR